MLSVFSRIYPFGLILCGILKASVSKSIGVAGHIYFLFLFVCNQVLDLWLRFFLFTFITLLIHFIILFGVVVAQHVTPAVQAAASDKFPLL